MYPDNRDSVHSSNSWYTIWVVNLSVINIHYSISFVSLQDNKQLQKHTLRPSKTRLLTRSVSENIRAMSARIYTQRQGELPKHEGHVLEFFVIL